VTSLILILKFLQETKILLFIFGPALPIAIIILPQLGSSPAIAVLTRGELAIEKAGPNINLKKLSIKFGDFKIIQDGKLHQSYDEIKTSKYMKSDFIDFDIEIFTGNKNFTVYIWASFTNRHYNSSPIRVFTSNCSFNKRRVGN
jgi:hypothetical protein